MPQIPDFFFPATVITEAIGPESYRAVYSNYRSIAFDKKFLLLMHSFLVTCEIVNIAPYHVGLMLAFFRPHFLSHQHGTYLQPV